MEEKTPIQQLTIDLYSKYKPEKVNSLTEEALRQIENKYQGDYKKLIEDFYGKYVPEKISMLNEDVYGNIEKKYGLKKKESTTETSLPTTEISQDELKTSRTETPSTSDWRKTFNQKLDLSFKSNLPKNWTTYQFPDFSKLKNDLKVVSAPTNADELLEVEGNTGNKQKDETGEVVSKKLLNDPNTSLSYIGSKVIPYLKRALADVNIGMADVIESGLKIVKIPDRLGIEVARYIYGDDAVQNDLESINAVSNKLGLGDAYKISKDLKYHYFHAEPTDVRDQLVSYYRGENIKLEEESKKEGTDNILGNIIGSTAKIVPDLVASSIMPEIKIEALSRYGFTHLSNFPLLMGTKAATQEELPTSLRGVKKFASGWLEGTSYEALGLLSGGVARSLGESVQKSIVKGGKTEIEAMAKTVPMEATARIALNATSFGGYDAIQQYIQTGRVDVGQMAESIGVGLALSGRDIIESTKSINEVIRQNVERKKYATMLTSSYNEMQNISSNPIKINELRSESNRLAEEIDKETDVQKKAELSIKKGVIDNSILLDAKIKDIVMFPEEEIKNVQDSKELTAEEKSYALDKINKILDTNDPLRIESKRLAAQIDPINAEIENIKVSELPQTAKDAIIQGKEKQIKEIQKQIGNLYSEPKYFVGDKEVTNADAILKEVEQVYKEEGYVPRVKVSNDIEGRDAVVKGIEDIISGKPKAEEVKTEATPTEKNTPTEQKKEENIFDLRQNELTLQKNQYEEANRQNEGGTAPSEMGGVNIRGEVTQGGLGEAPRYDVGEGDRISGHGPIKEISIPNKEANEIKNTMQEKVVFDKSFEEVNSAEKFHEQITKSKEGNKWSASVFVYPVEEYQTSRKYLTKDGKAGLSITKDGDIISVFSYDKGKGRTPQLIINAIKGGGRTLDHYDTRLTDYYSQFGFVPVARVKWNDEFAPSDWNKETFKDYNNGEPDVIAMAYHGGDPNTLYQRIGKFKNVKELLDKTPYVETWEEAKRLQKEYADKVSQELKSEEETNYATGKERRSEYQRTDEGQQEKGKSEGEQRQETQQETNLGDSFKRSREEQEKEVVYHGTTKDFTEFDLSKKGQTDSGWLGEGIYFHSDPNRGGYGDIVKSAKVNLKNPIELPVENAGKYLYDIIGEKAGLGKEWAKQSAQNIIREIGSKRFTELAKELGYDGVVSNYVEGTKEIVSFDTKNIEIVDQNINKKETTVNIPTTDKEKTLAFSAGIDEISASFDVPDMPKEKQKEASDKLVSLIKDNATSFEHVPPRLVDDLIQEASKINPENTDRTLKYINKVINNVDFAHKIAQIKEEKGKLNINSIKDKISDLKTLKMLNIRTSLGKKGEKVSSWINNIKMSELDPDMNMVDDFYNLLQGLNKKGTPDVSLLEPFRIKYAKVLDEIINQKYLKKVKNVDEKNVNEKLNKLSQDIDAINDLSTADDIIKLRREVNATLSAINSMIEKQILSESLENSVKNSEAYKKIKELAEGKQTELGKLKEEVERKELEFKNNQVKKIVSSISSIDKNGLTDSEKEKLGELQSIAKQVFGNKEMLKYIPSQNLEYLKDAIDNINEYGIIPTSLYKYAEKLDEARLAGETQTDVLGTFDQKIKEGNKLATAFAGKSEDEMRKVLEVGSAWAQARKIDITEKFKGVLRNRLYTTLTFPSIAKINTARNESEKILNEIKDALIKALPKQTLLQKIRGYEFGNDATKELNAKIGILMVQRRFNQLLGDGMKNVVKTADGYRITDFNGEYVKDQGKALLFDDIETARSWAKDNVEKVIGEDNLDFYNLITKGKYKDRKERSRFGKKQVETNQKWVIFDNAYNKLTNNGRNKLSIKTDEDAYKYLTKEEINYYKTLRNTLDKLRTIASEVAAAEGKSLASEGGYFPMQSKSRELNLDVDDFVENGIFNSQIFDGTLPEVAGYINPKTSAINAVNFDAYQVVSKYVNDMMVSYHVLPIARKQFGALKKLYYEYEKMNPDVGNNASMKRFVLALRDDLKLAYQSEYAKSMMGGNIKIPVEIFGKGKYIDLSAGYRKFARLSSDLLIQVPDRIIRDALPNSELLGINPIRALTKPEWKDKKWIDFADKNPDTVLSENLDDFVNRYSFGLEEGLPVEKTWLRDLADRNRRYGDMTTSKEAFIKYFQKYFKTLKGEDFDIEKYSNDEQYRNELKYDKDFNEAKALAHEEVSRKITPQTLFERTKYLGTMGYTLGIKRGDTMFNIVQPLTMYVQNQATKWADNVRNIIYDSNDGRWKSVQSLGAQYASEITYMLLASGSTAMLKYAANKMAGHDDKAEYYKEQGNKIFFDYNSYLTQFVATNLQLMTGGYANLGRNMMTAGYSALKYGLPAVSDSDKAKKAEWMYTFKKIDNIANRFIPVNYDITAKNTDQAQLISMLFPVVGSAGTRIIGETSNIVNALSSTDGFTDKIANENINGFQLANSLTYLMSARFMNPLAMTTDQITKSLEREYGSYMRTEDAAYIGWNIGDFRLLYEDANDRVKAANESDRHNGDEVMEYFLDKNAGEYRSRYNFYSKNKNKIDEINDLLNKIEKNKYIPFKEKSELWRGLREYTHDMNDQYEKYRTNPSTETLIWNPLDTDTNTKIYQQIKMVLMEADAKKQKESIEKFDVNKEPSMIQFKELMKQIGKKDNK